MWALGGDGTQGGGMPQGEDGLGRKCVPRKKMRLERGCASEVKMGLRDDLDLVVGWSLGARDKNLEWWASRKKNCLLKSWGEVRFWQTSQKKVVVGLEGPIKLIKQSKFSKWRSLGHQGPQPWLSGCIANQAIFNSIAIVNIVCPFTTTLLCIVTIISLKFVH